MSSSPLAAVFEGRRHANSLNVVRLVLASGVVVQHSHVVQTGMVFSSHAADQLVGQLPVDGFFALSGFLIAKSWVDRPKASAFLQARVARIFPAFLTCLVVTGLLLAPASSVALQNPVLWDSNFGYLWRNASLVVFQNGIDGTLSEVPFRDDWNASLWTLKWEFACYIAVMVAGRLGLLRRTSVVTVVFGLVWLANVALNVRGVDGFAADGARLGLMFGAGTLLYLYSDRLPFTRVCVAGSMLVVVVAGFGPIDYRVIAAPFIAYGTLGVGLALTNPRLVLRNDISYGVYIYAFPVQQLLILAGFEALPLAVFCLLSLVGTIPFAILSWKLTRAARTSLDEATA